MLEALSQDKLGEMIARSATGLNALQAANNLGICRKTVYRILKHEHENVTPSKATGRSCSANDRWDRLLYNLVHRERSK